MNYFDLPGLLLQSTTVTAPVATGSFLPGFSPPELVVLATGLFVFLAAAVYLIHLGDSFMVLRRIQLLEKYHPEVLQTLGVPIPEEVLEPWYQSLYKRLTDDVPIAEEAIILLDHSYDGVRELDNNLPPWWTGLFYITIAIAPVYIWFVHFSGFDQTQGEEYATEMQVSEEAVKAFVSTQANAVDESNVTLLAENNALEKGRLIFEGKCSPCHGTLGEGGIGPNLTDEFWIHGGSITDVFKTIKYGVPEKGMIAWQKEMSASAMQEVSSYIITLVGTDPPNAKEAQGELYTEGEKSK
ncbi:cbb3-type cytochrome c oxidase N-terminal domain-containing protein [Neolewinella antarctica]|uniref:Cytochrome c oxidase cbb3-type subunit 3 n=1 Tax=Neolewinella antarctica TaxID=442734 RepID=A0ABX0X9W6_9BACT|nr:cbb3-type cytochrome c oxidase N-terminal domain-containing protein [Neolewinella antarctica]NJC25577.1 cytochrome c oxidase cbb3-type subunit 3 [Neolewinella antarctica]